MSIFVSFGSNFVIKWRSDDGGSIPMEAILL